MNTHPVSNLPTAPGRRRRPPGPVSWAAARALWLGLALNGLAGHALAQDQIVLPLSIAQFEGNSGITLIEVPVAFGLGPGTEPNNAARTLNNVFLKVSAVPNPFGGSPARPGAACGPGVDYIGFENRPLDIPAGTLGGVVKIPVQVCANTLVDSSRRLIVTAETRVGPPVCGERCGTLVTILNDDGPPALFINDVTVTEPPSGSRVATFTVTASHPPPLDVTVRFGTRDGTAGATRLCAPFAGSPCVTLRDFTRTSGVLTLPAGVRRGTIAVSVLADPNGVDIVEPDETFFVDLSGPVNATLLSAAGATGQGTIKDFKLAVGTFSLSQAGTAATVGETGLYGVEWTVPAHLVWRSLDTIDLRIRGAQSEGEFLRWSEAANTFSVCRRGHGRDDDDDRNVATTRFGAICGLAQQPGSPSFLQLGRQAVLDLSRTRVTGSGPTGTSVMVDLALSFLPKTAGHTLTLELAAADDFGNEDRFVPAGRVRVDRGR